MGQAKRGLDRVRGAEGDGVRAAVLGRRERDRPRCAGEPVEPVGRDQRAVGHHDERAAFGGLREPERYG